MVSFAKLGAYAAWIAVALTAAAARPASADLFDSQRQAPARSETLNEATSFADSDEPRSFVDSDEPTPGGSVERPDDEAEMLVGTWAWEGTIEGMWAHIATAFYPDGTYESHARTPVIALYEVGTWTLADGVLTTVVVDYAPQVIQTAYGPQAVPIEPEYRTPLAFLDEDTVETEIGRSYRID
jgi:hypothetical protein